MPLVNIRRELTSRIPLYPEETQQIIDALNNPQKELKTFDPTAIVVDTPGTYTPYTATGNISLTFTGTPKKGIFQSCIITFSNDTLTAPVGSYIRPDDFTNGESLNGTYRVWWMYDGNSYEIGLYTLTLIS